LRTARRPAFQLAGAAAVLAAVVVACAGEESPPAATTPTVRTISAPAGPPTAGATPSATAPPTPVADVVIAVTVSGAGRKVSTAEDRVKIKRGQSVALTITSDQADEVHIHGYDLTKKLTPEKPTTFTFDADLPGSWEVELHDAHKVLVRLEVAG